jgi:hypothetical protein
MDSATKGGLVPIASPPPRMFQSTESYWTLQRDDVISALVHSEVSIHRVRLWTPQPSRPTPMYAIRGGFNPQSPTKDSATGVVELATDAETQTFQSTES